MSSHRTASDRPPDRVPEPLPHEPILAAAREIGFALCGITTPDPSDHIDHLRAWLAEGRHGTMGWLEREESISRRADLRGTMPEVRSVVVVADEYGDPDRGNPPSAPDRGIIARYARGRDYHRVLPKKLTRLGERIAELAGRDIVARTYVDTGPILERELARRAGLGWFGRNTMLINPRRGSYLFLGTLLVDVAIEPTPAFEADHCGSCRACLDACPTDALLGRDENGAPVLDSNRCISYLTIEHRGSIPPELRPAIGNRVFGCDICQEVCPWNERFARVSREPGYAARGAGERPTGVEPARGEAEVDAPEGVSAETWGFGNPPHPGTYAPSLVELMRMTDEGWEALSRGSALRRTGHAGLRRNVAVALGNWLRAGGAAPSRSDAVEGDAPSAGAAAEDVLREAVEGDASARRAAEAALREAVEEDEPLVAEHAEWALGQIEGRGSI